MVSRKCQLTPPRNTATPTSSDHELKQFHRRSRSHLIKEGGSITHIMGFSHSHPNALRIFMSHYLEYE